jgi:hypothetical protein
MSCSIGDLASAGVRLATARRPSQISGGDARALNFGDSQRAGLYETTPVDLVHRRRGVPPQRRRTRIPCSSSHLLSGRLEPVVLAGWIPFTERLPKQHLLLHATGRCATRCGRRPAPRAKCAGLDASSETGLPSRGGCGQSGVAQDQHGDEDLELRAAVGPIDAVVDVVTEFRATNIIERPKRPLLTAPSRVANVRRVDSGWEALST